VETRVRTDIREYIVSTWLSGDGRGFHDDADLQQTGILDSFSTLVLVAFLDERFDVQLDPPDINAATFQSVASVARLVVDKLGETRRTDRRIA
jgi:acyl carrier protein